MDYNLITLIYVISVTVFIQVMNYIKSHASETSENMDWKIIRNMNIINLVSKTLFLKTGED